jgi:chromate transporter
LNAALSAITAAIVGVILNLSVWFTVHSVFRVQQVGRIGPLEVEMPVWSSLDPFALLLGAAALVAMLRFKLGLAWTLAGCALIGATGTLLRG